MQEKKFHLNCYLSNVLPSSRKASCILYLEIDQVLYSNDFRAINQIISLLSGRFFLESVYVLLEEYNSKHIYVYIYQNLNIFISYVSCPENEFQLISRLKLIYPFYNYVDFKLNSPSVFSIKIY